MGNLVFNTTDIANANYLCYHVSITQLYFDYTPLYSSWKLKEDTGTTRVINEFSYELDLQMLRNSDENDQKLPEINVMSKMDQLDIHLSPFTYKNLLAIGDLLTPDALKTEADFYENQKRDQMAKKDHAGLVLRYDKRHKVAVYDMIMLGNFLNLYNHTSSSDYLYYSIKGVFSEK